jgi:hypothetical protein
MLGDIFYRLRQIAPNRSVVVTFGGFFVLLEGGIRYMEARNIPIVNNLPFRPGYVLLLMQSVIHGLNRVVFVHPIWNSGYQTWLESTPWTSRKPLPMGPAELVWQDGLVLGPLILLSGLLPEPGAVHLLCAFLLSHLVALTVTLFLTGVWANGYVTAFALGLAVWLWRQPLACLVASTTVYLIAYEGLWRGFDQFPWKRFDRPNTNAGQPSRNVPAGTCGWPHDRMMGEVVGTDGISRIDAVLCCMLGSWWLFVLSWLIGDHNGARTPLMFPFAFALVGCPLGRLYFYILGYISPITFWARIWTGRWIIPGYDQVFVGPICSFLVGPSSLALLRAWSVPLDLSLAIATGLTVLVALITPPRLKRWRLTGQHRIVFAMSLENSQANTKVANLVKVG